MIIAKWRWQFFKISFWLIVLLAALLRLWRIAELTEFLGDQGRTGIHIYQAWTTKTLPLVGPTVLSGQHLGPAFYYLIAPFFILGRFDPLWPAVGTALFGIATVALIWWLLKQWFGWIIASLVSLLYAVSPSIIFADRTLWEPNLVPFFTTLFLVCLFLIMKSSRIRLFSFVLGVTIGILVQLHYPNVISLFLTGIFYGYLWLGKKLSLRLLLQSSCLVVIGCLFALLPFLYYEATHNFENITGVVRIMLSSGSAPLGKRVWLWNVIDYSMRVFGRIFPVSHFISVILLMAVGLGAAIRKEFWLRFLALWLFTGVGAMAFYRGVVYDHYLYFVTSVPFFLLGHGLASILSPSRWMLCSKRSEGHSWKVRFTRMILLGLIGIVVVIWIQKLDIWGKEVNDIHRAKEVVAKMTELAAGQPFSFTLVKSRSFSDLHYRYFFETAGIKPHPITSNEYQLLFLVCETGDCSNAETIIKQRFISVLCYEDHCRGPYPEIDLNKWKLAETISLADSALYQLVRANN